MGIVTVTERQVFKRCRKRWDYSSHSRQNLESIIPPVALSLGKIVHEVHAEWMVEENPESTDVVDLVMKFAQRELAAIRIRYREHVGTEVSDDELGGFWDTVGLARTMLGNYKEQWKTPLPKGFRLLAPEQTAIVPIPGSNCAMCGHRFDKHGDLTGGCYAGYEKDDTFMPCNCNKYEPHNLEGTFDFLVADKHDRVFVGERKTYRARPKPQSLAENDQFLAYCWMVQQLGFRVGGVLYDGMWKRDVSPKVPLKDLFYRDLLTRPQYEIDRFGEYLALEANEICSGPDIYLNRRWEGCYDCPFEKMCIAEHRGEDWISIRDTQFTHRKDGVRALLAGETDDD